MLNSVNQSINPFSTENTVHIKEKQKGSQRERDRQMTEVRKEQTI